MKTKFSLGILILATLAIILIFNLFFLPTKSPTAQEKAVLKVQNLPEVTDFLKRVPNGIVRLDHEDEETNSWVIQVYEVKNGHTATFNWYRVNRETGAIKKEF